MQDQPDRAQLVDAGNQRGGCAHPRHLLNDDARRDGIRTLTAVLLGHMYRRKSSLIQYFQRFFRKAQLPVDLGCVWRDLRLTDIPQHRT